MIRIQRCGIECCNGLHGFKITVLLFLFFFFGLGGGGGIRDQVRPGINSCHTILDKKNGIVVMKDIPHYGHRD